MNSVNSTLVLFGPTIFGEVIELVTSGTIGHAAYIFRSDFVEVEGFGAVISGA